MGVPRGLVDFTSSPLWFISFSVAGRRPVRLKLPGSAQIARSWFVIFSFDAWNKLLHSSSVYWFVGTSTSNVV